MHYLDNAATTWPKPEVVYQTLDDTFRHMHSPKRGTSSAARGGADKLMAARQAVAELIHAPNPMQIAFTNGCTHALNLAINAYPWQAGDEVVMSAIEHHALSRPIRKMAREKGITFHVVPYTDETPFDLAAYETLLKTRPDIKLVATTHASNVIGSMLPVAEIGRLAHQYGKLYLVDAAQSAGVIDLDVQAMNIDLMALPGHKSLYGPPGVGALYVAEGVQLNTFMEGGTGNDSGKHAMAAKVPDGLEVGTIPLPQILAFAEGIRWVQAEGLEKIRTHERELLAHLLTTLRGIEGLTIYGHQRIEEKTPVVSFNLSGWQPKDVGNLLYDEFGIALRAGYHCAPMTHEAIGTLNGPDGGTIRASLGYTTQRVDIDALGAALTQVCKREAPVATA